MRPALLLPSGKALEIDRLSFWRLTLPWAALDALLLFVLFEFAARIRVWPWTDLLLFLQLYLAFMLVALVTFPPLVSGMRAASNARRAGGGEQVRKQNQAPTEPISSPSRPSSWRGRLRRRGS